MYRNCLLLLVMMGSSLASIAQAPAFDGWFFSSHEQKLSRRWSLLTDIQCRSAAKLSYLKAVLLRPAFSFSINGHSSLAAGYTYFLTNEKDKGDVTTTGEHRTWQQFVYTSKPGNGELSNRLRLEQRFLQPASGGDDFAQRLRYYIRFQRPLKAGREFKKGAYLSAQHELFLNITNRSAVNDRLFDQDRLYLGSGYRFSESMEVEAGYLFRYQRESGGRIRDHILQFSVNTKL